MMRRPRPPTLCRTCPVLANERNMARGLLGAAVRQLGGRLEVPPEQWRALEGTELEVEKQGGVWIVTSVDPADRGRNGRD
jgi:hypothetical protein